jgi:formylglycine-generating enzyme required for sulfatase activity
MDDSKSWRDPGFTQTDADPVACVSWNDARAYFQWLSNKTAKDYRLPTEAEWEYAARAGTKTRYSFGDTINDKDANFNRNLDKTTRVGSYPANPWGLHDVHGNVWEWVADCYEADAYKTHKSYPAMDGGWQDSCLRVLRGGSWGYYPRDLRSANRSGGDPDFRFYGRGFRVARTLN